MGSTDWMFWRKHSWAQTIINYFIVFPLISFVIWAIGYICFGDLALPGGNLFALGVLELVAVLLGHFFECIELPGMLGMFSAGLLIRNIPHLNFAEDLDPKMTNILRGTSVVILLTRGALSVNPTVIKKFGWVIPQLAVGACVIDAAIGGVTAYFILGFQLPWAAAMGCIMSGMSQALIMPYLNKIEKDGFAITDKAIVIAKNACGLDAILAISMTECAYGFIFASGELSGGLMKGILEVSMGLGLAIVWGTLAGLFLEEAHGGTLRTFVLFAGGVIALPGLTFIGYPRGGPPGCFFGTLIAACLWRSKCIDGKNNDKVNKNFLKLWYIFQPLLFGIIGARTNLSVVNWAVMLRGVACLAINLCVRMSAVFCLLGWSELTVREKFAICVTWVPKGTVQAALGPVPLETFNSGQYDPAIGEMAEKVMNVAAIVIVLASSLGAFLLLTVAPKLFRRKS